MDNSADFSEVPYLVDEFSNMWEDAYGGSSWVSSFVSLDVVYGG